MSLHNSNFELEYKGGEREEYDSKLRYGTLSAENPSQFQTQLLFRTMPGVPVVRGQFVASWAFTSGRDFGGIAAKSRKS